MRFLFGLIALWMIVFSAPTQAETFRICHGYDCYYRTKLIINAHDEKIIKGFFLKNARSAEAERDALRKAISYFEERSTAVIGIRDEPRMRFGRARNKGQMDCVDESTNTDAFMRYLQSRGWMVHHTVSRRTTRGSFFDGRYPHWTAVIKENNGELWAVDSWFEAGGGPPDILLLADWKRRGYGGNR